MKIIADTKEEREKALDKLLPIQRDDFKNIFSIMAPRPVTIRLLDPPIHEFLPQEQQLIDEIDILRNLRKNLRGLRVLSDTVSFMYQNDPAPSKGPDSCRSGTS